MGFQGSWHLFQGKVEYGVLSRNTLYNGGATWYMIARQTIIEGNNATGSSPIAGGNGFNFAQHLYLARNTVRNVRGNDREVMTYDAEGAQYTGPPTLINATHVVSPNCPGRMDSRFDLANAFNSAPRGGVIAILDGPGAGLYRRVIGWGATGAPTNYDTAPCWWAINRPFPDALGGANMSAMVMVVTFFAGRSLFVDNTFTDTGHFQLYHSGIENVLSGTTMARMGGAWAGGMSVGIRSYLNNSAGPLAPNPTLFSEFTDNAVTVGQSSPNDTIGFGFQNGAKHLDLRCVFRPSTEGAGCEKHVSNPELPPPKKIKKIHLTYDSFGRASGAARLRPAPHESDHVLGVLAAACDGVVWDGWAGRDQGGQPVHGVPPQQSQRRQRRAAVGASQAHIRTETRFRGFKTAPTIVF